MRRVRLGVRQSWAGRLDVRAAFERRYARHRAARAEQGGTRLLAPDVEKLAASAFERFPDLREVTIARADAALAHRFELLGSGAVDLGPHIDWHADFKTGRRWDPRRHYRRLEDYVDTVSGGDVIVPWELSRFQHATALGVAWLATHDERYTREFVAQVESWLRSNEYPLGINWASTMDVAIRAVNWLWGYELMAAGLPSPFKRRLFEELFRHAGHIYRNPEEWDGLRNNHYVADMSGLTILGALFRSSRSGRMWLRTGIGALEREIVRQTYPDGTNFEGSTNYHRLSAELFLVPALALRRIGEQTSSDYRDRLSGMARFVAAYTRPDGSWPQLGDTDDGRLQIFDTSSMRDHRYLIGAIASYVADPAIKALYPVLEPEAFWMAGDLARAFDELPAVQAQMTSRFPDGGYYVLADRDRGDWTLIRCGPVGIPGTGGHGHCDALAVEIAVRGKPLLVDRGTGVYTADPPLRNLYRSTRMHNTLRIDGAEQNEFDPRRLWYMPDQARASCLRFGPTRFDGQHAGYARLAGSLLHRRTVEYDADSGVWEIQDHVEGMGRHRVEAFWHFAPGRRVELVGETVVTDLARLELDGPQGLVVRIDDSLHSESYGRQAPAKCAVCVIEAPLPIELRARIRPSETIF